ncbi:hypothetical protein [Thermococcus thioreducens]|uniref:Uncharacterized protein n=1 Tax=Thermococcus thioreducens TaxID=277988 RepID=A0A0Q2QNG6_9EURY|nr:hypothetical protein [Thermococcus thioreducens]ASJ12116.1 hypothetical protein A3L14_04125 [Thermococcus thioreducens]KQH81413.1 hypothetical protein AMR53_11520 [Thermococcus thioreducens]SEW08078.1 hypothetical protein SAMN05216170_1445 [Thermococcus thioreducens]
MKGSITKGVVITISVFSIIFTFWWGEITNSQYYYTLLSLIFWSIAFGVLFWSTNWEKFFEMTTFIPYWITIANLAAAYLENPILWLLILFTPWLLIDKTFTEWEIVLHGLGISSTRRARVFMFTFLPSLLALVIDGVNLGSLYLQVLATMYSGMLVLNSSSTTLMENSTEQEKNTGARWGWK